MEEPIEGRSHSSRLTPKASQLEAKSLQLAPMAASLLEAWQGLVDRRISTIIKAPRKLGTNKFIKML